jgi:hypothetical protein
VARRDRDILSGPFESSREGGIGERDLDEARAVAGSHPVTVQAKMLRFELLNVKADMNASKPETFLDHYARFGILSPE